MSQQWEQLRSLAVQAAREAARRIQCMNNLKQIGLALQGIHDAERALPQGVYGDPRKNATDNSQGLSWMTKILPYIEVTLEDVKLANRMAPEEVLAGKVLVDGPTFC